MKQRKVGMCSSTFLKLYWCTPLTVTSLLHRRYYSAHVRTQTQLHSLFFRSRNLMWQLTDTTGERPVAGLTLRALRATAVIKLFYNSIKSICQFGTTRELIPRPFKCQPHTLPTIPREQSNKCLIKINIILLNARFIYKFICTAKYIYLSILIL